VALVRRFNTCCDGGALATQVDEASSELLVSLSTFLDKQTPPVQPQQYFLTCFLRGRASVAS
jgi:hypothetical protein